MKRILLCALLCAPVACSHAADVAAVAVAPQTDARQLAWKTALALNDIAAARKLVDAPGFSPTLRLEGWNTTLIYGALEQRRGEIAAIILERAPAEFFVTGKSQLANLGATANLPALRALLLRGGFDPNTRDASGLTPLLEAANERNVGGVAALLADTRTNLNARNEKGETALFRANSFAGATKIVAMLLADKRTDVNALDNDGNSALHAHAADLIGTPTLELLLLDARMETNLKNKAGQTPLDVAIATGDNSRGAELMRALGVRVSKSQALRMAELRARYEESTPTENQRAWLRIIAANDLRAARKRVERTDFDPLLKVPGGDALLNEALLREHAALALILMDAAPTDAYLRVKNPDVFLARTANWPVLQRFLKRADFNPNGTTDSEPLIFTAIDDGNIEGVRALLAHPNIQPNARDFLRRGPLSALTTSKPNAAKIAQLLLANARIDPNLRYEDGTTDLHNLAWFASPDVLRVLVADARVRLDVADNYGKTPLYMAASKNLDNARILIESGRVKLDPKAREKIAERKADWGIGAVDLWGELK